jgi:hypothetical protein
MLVDFINWWQTLWVDATIIGGAIAGFISALIMFLLGDVIWKTRMEHVKSKREFWQKQLDQFYAPLYRFYREAYTRFHYWKLGNPETSISRQPFFESGQNEIFVEKIFAKHPGYASQSILRLWADFSTIEDKELRNAQREKFVFTLIKEYQELRRKLDLDYDKAELESGEFNSAV